MFTARFPIEFIVRGSYSSECQFQICSSETLLRYERIEGQPEDGFPAVLSGRYSEPWFIDEVETGTGPRLFKLSLFGPTITNLLQCDPEHPLVTAVLDQRTITLSINMGPIPPDGVGPDVAKDFVVTLFLKLILHIS
jgi:hypothetical protein